jgi:hypothetical protein
LEKLNQNDIYSVLSLTLPKQNDFFETDYAEELQELFDFGIDTKIALENLIVEHKESLLKIDSEELEEFEIKFYKEEFGEEFVNERVKNKFWFSYSALLRLALELEFDEKYIEYSIKRDGL